MVAASDRMAIAFHLSVGQCYDAPQGRLLSENERLEKLPKEKKIYLAMDKGYEDDLTRKIVKEKALSHVFRLSQTGKNLADTTRKYTSAEMKLNGYFTD